MCWIVRPLFCKSIWKPTRRVHIIKEDVSNGITSFLARKTSVNYRLDFVDPWHQYRASGVSNHDCVRIVVCNDFDQFITESIDIKTYAIERFSGISIDKDDG
ncbi:unnamed protein product [Umbelopsis ramanniana]